MKEIKIDSDFFNKYLFFFNETIGNITDRDGKIYFLDDKDIKIKDISAKKFNSSKYDKHSIVPRKKDGETFEQKYLNVRTTIIYEDEARNTSSALYCFKMIAEDKVYYKVGITATEYAPDKSNLGLIQYRINEIENDFLKKENGSLKFYPLFIVKSSLLNCIMLEKVIHENSVFCGAIANKYKKFTGINECCNIPDFDHFKKLKIETDILSAELKLKHSKLKEQYFEKYDNNEAYFEYFLDCGIINKDLELNEYGWEKFGNFEDNGINFEKNDKIIQNFRNFEHLKYLKDWIRLSEYNQQ